MRVEGVLTYFLMEADEVVCAVYDQESKSRNGIVYCNTQDMNEDVRLLIKLESS